MALALHTQSPVTGWISLLEMCIWVFMEQRHGVLVEKLDDGMIGILYYVDTKAYFHLPGRRNRDYTGTLAGDIVPGLRNLLCTTDSCVMRNP